MVADSDDATLLCFYDEFADDYHLAYGGNWEDAVERQGSALDALIRDVLPDATTVLDCSCGIGTQALGLAKLGYRVVGSDISAGEIERAQREGTPLSFPDRRATFSSACTTGTTTSPATQCATSCLPKPATTGQSKNTRCATARSHGRS